jgi:hypothetical protein
MFRHLNQERFDQAKRWLYMHILLSVIFFVAIILGMCMPEWQTFKGYAHNDQAVTREIDLGPFVCWVTDIDANNDKSQLFYFTGKIFYDTTSECEQNLATDV